MEENSKHKYPIWGKWWASFRKWFYPVWLAYESSIRFYEYAVAAHSYCIDQQDFLSNYIGKFGTHALGIFCGAASFAICSLYLTLPACLAIFRFFKEESLTNTVLEEKLKTIL